MARAPGRALGLHCLLYLSADEICPLPPRAARRLAESLLGNRSRLMQLTGSVLAASVTLDRRLTGNTSHRIAVPCRPGVEVSAVDLASQLLMAALLECRTAGRVELRLADRNLRWRMKATMSPWRGRAWVVLLDSATLPGVCGRILEELQHSGEQRTDELLTNTMAHPRGGHRGESFEWWVINHVRAELADLGYVRTERTRERLGVRTVYRFVDDCQQIKVLQDECAIAVGRWRQVWSTEQELCEALLADCTAAITTPRGGGGG